jgi:two-component system, NarL family, response regulator LiaR
LRRLKVLVADDHRLMLEAIRSALEAADFIEVVGETQSGAQVVPLVHQLNPDVVLLDIRMPGMDGLAVLDLMCKRHPDVKVVLLSGVDDPHVIHAGLARGASAFVAKTVDPGDLASVIRQAADGSVYQMNGPAGSGESFAAKESGLSERELTILRALGKGLSNKQIARELWVAEQTVKFHLTNIYRKLDVANRTEAARYAYRHGLAESPVFEESASAV